MLAVCSRSSMLPLLRRLPVQGHAVLSVPRFKLSARHLLQKANPLRGPLLVPLANLSVADLQQEIGNERAANGPPCQARCSQDLPKGHRGVTRSLSVRVFAIADH